MLALLFPFYSTKAGSYDLRQVWNSHLIKWALLGFALIFQNAKIRWIQRLTYTYEIYWDANSADDMCCCSTLRWSQSMNWCQKLDIIPLCFPHLSAPTPLWSNCPFVLGWKDDYSFLRQWGKWLKVSHRLTPGTSAVITFANWRKCLKYLEWTTIILNLF